MHRALNENQMRVSNGVRGGGGHFGSSDGFVTAPDSDFDSDCEKITVNVNEKQVTAKDTARTI